MVSIRVLAVLKHYSLTITQQQSINYKYIRNIHGCMVGTITEEEVIEGNEIEEEITFGDRTVILTAKVVGSGGIEDNSITIEGRFNRSKYKGKLKALEVKSQNGGGYIVSFSEDVFTTVTKGDVICESVSKVRVSDEFGDTVFTAFGEPTIEEKRHEQQLDELVTQTKFIAMKDDDFKQRIANAIDADL